MVNLAVVGLGYWGPNLVRNLASLENVRVSVLCDQDPKRAESIRHRFSSGSRICSDIGDVGDDVDAVVIATPIRTHYELGKYFLSRGKHVFIEKPLARTEEECLELIDLAERQRRVLMVGHVFEFNAAVRKIKSYLAAGELGRLFYVYSQRVNLGRIQNDVNALWSFAPHDISIMNYWLDQEPVRVSARGFSFLNSKVEDVVFVTLEYPNGIGVHLHLGWMDPRKVRLMTLVGSKKMLVYDDVSLDAKIQLFDKGIARLHDFIESPESFAEFQFQIRVGDVTIPTFAFNEPLQDECRHFISCIEGKQRPTTDGMNGLRVVRVLEAAERSLRNNGQPIELVPGVRVAP
jgi:predicted dehydrogenase